MTLQQKDDNHIVYRCIIFSVLNTNQVLFLQNGFWGNKTLWGDKRWIKRLYLPPYSNHNAMKHQSTIVTILLNILFCATMLWFFSKNAYLRPYLGSTANEFLSGLLLLATLYANYYVFYPKLHRGHIYVYWFSVVAASLTAGCLELALGYTFITKCYALIIAETGTFGYFAKHMVFVFSRNLAFNFFPYMLRERKFLQQSLETEVKVVYQYARMLDVCDDKNNCQHIPVDNILYCKKYGNETEVYILDGIKFTRYCTLKYMSQMFGNVEFIRVSTSIIVPFQHIASCDGKSVVMKTMPWMKTPLTFKLDSKRFPQIAAAIDEYLLAIVGNMDDVQPDCEEEKDKKSQSVPPEEKLDAVFNYIREHPGCRSTELMSHTGYSQTTTERCLFELKKRRLIQYTGSKKTGGYQLL